MHHHIQSTKKHVLFCTTYKFSPRSDNERTASTASVKQTRAWKYLITYPLKSKLRRERERDVVGVQCLRRVLSIKSRHRLSYVSSMISGPPSSGSRTGFDSFPIATFLERQRAAFLRKSFICLSLLKRYMLSRPGAGFD